MTQIVEKRDALLDRPVRMSRLPEEIEKMGHDFVKRLNAAMPRVAEVAKQIVSTEGWTKTTNLAFEPYPAEEGSPHDFAIRLRDNAAQDMLQEKLASKMFADGSASENGIFQSFITDDGVTFLRVWVTRKDEVTRYPLTWKEFTDSDSFENFEEFQTISSMERDASSKSVFNNMELWVKHELNHEGQDLAEECVERIEEWQHDGGLYAKRQFPQLHGTKNPLCAAWLFGAKIRQGEAWSKQLVTFSCTKDGHPSTIPCSSVDNALRSETSWAEMLQCSEEEYEECLSQAFSDARFWENDSKLADSEPPANTAHTSKICNARIADGNASMHNVQETTLEEWQLAGENPEAFNNHGHDCLTSSIPKMIAGEKPKKMNNHVQMGAYASEPPMTQTLEKGSPQNLLDDPAYGDAWRSMQCMSSSDGYPHAPNYLWCDTTQTGGNAWVPSTGHWPWAGNNPDLLYRLDPSTQYADESHLIGMAKDVYGTRVIQEELSGGQWEELKRYILQVVTKNLRELMFNPNGIHVIKECFRLQLTGNRDIGELGTQFFGTAHTQIMKEWDSLLWGATSAFTYKIIMWVLEAFHVQFEDKLLLEACKKTQGAAQQLLRSQYGQIVMQHAMLFTQKALCRSTGAEKDEWCDLRNCFFEDAIRALQDRNEWDKKTNPAGHFINLYIECIIVDRKTLWPRDWFLELHRAQIILQTVADPSLFRLICNNKTGQYTARRIYEIAEGKERRKLEEMTNSRIDRIELRPLTKFQESLLLQNELNFPSA